MPRSSSDGYASSCGDWLEDPAKPTGSVGDSSHRPAQDHAAATPAPHALREAAHGRSSAIVGWHMLRHTFASHLAMRGATLKVIQELLGHSTITMTMRYAHLAPRVAREAVQLLDDDAVPGSRFSAATLELS